MGMAWIRLKLEDDTHRKLKAAAALEGLTLAAYLARVLDAAARKDTK